MANYLGSPVRQTILRVLREGAHMPSYGAVADYIGHTSSGHVSRILFDMVLDGTLVMNDQGVLTCPGLGGSVTNARAAKSAARRDRINARRNRGPVEETVCLKCGCKFPAVYNEEIKEFGQVIRRKSLVYRLCYNCRNGLTKGDL